MKWLALLMMVLMTACAHTGKPQAGTSSQGHGADSSPERAASQNLVTEGVRFLEEGNFDQAEDILREAVTIDPSNGEAYYHLAVVLTRSGRGSEAVGLLEKAEHLLGNDFFWQERLDDLKKELL